MSVLGAAVRAGRPGRGGGADRIGGATVSAARIAGTAVDRSDAAFHRPARPACRPADAIGFAPRPRPGQRGARTGNRLPHSRREHVAGRRPSRPGSLGRSCRRDVCSGVAGADHPRYAGRLGARHAGARHVQRNPAHAEADRGRRHRCDGPRAVRAWGIRPHPYRGRPRRRPADVARRPRGSGPDAARPAGDSGPNAVRASTDSDAARPAGGRAAREGAAAAADDRADARPDRRRPSFAVDRDQYRQRGGGGRGA